MFKLFKAFAKKFETTIIDGWGFVKPESDSGKHKLTKDGIDFHSPVGGMFVVAQMDPEHDPYILGMSLSIYLNILLAYLSKEY